MSTSPVWRPDVPFSPARVPLFYGWAVVAAGTLGVVFSLPGQTVGISVFTDVLMAELGLDRVQISIAYLLGTTTSGFLLPLGGRLFDRYGARRLGVWTSLALGAVLVAMSQSDRIARAIAELMSAVQPWATAFAVLTIAFFLLRFTGQGMLTMTSRSMIGKWFHRRRGLAMSVSGVVVSFAFSISPRVFDGLIQHFGWRGAWLLLAGSCGLGMATLAWLFFRDNPEECGLTMDGGPAPPSTRPGNPDLVVHRELDRGEAVRTYAFWIFALSFALQGLFVTGYTFHIISIGEELGLGRDRILGLFLPMAVVSVVANFSCGIWSDRTRLRWPLFLLALGVGVANLGFLSLPSAFGLPLAVLGLGISGGFFQSLSGVVFPRYFGRLHLGAIAGLNFSIVVIASAIGPFALSVSQALTGSYRPAFWGSLAISAALAAGALAVVNPQRREAGPSGEG